MTINVCREVYVLVDDKKELKGAPLGSSLSSVMENLFMEDVEETVLNKVIYRKSGYDTLIIMVTWKEKT